MKTIIFTTLLLVTGTFTKAQQPWPFQYNEAGTHSVILLGDNNFQYREQPEKAFQYVMPTLKSADFRILNLEGPFAGGTDDPEKSDIPHKSWRHSNPDQVAALTAANIDAVGVANNVTYPWQALMKSLQVLDSAGIRYAGGGENLAEAHQPVLLEKNGLKIGFMQYAATVFPTNHAALHNQPGIADIKVYTAYQPPKNLDKPGQPPYVITWLDEESRALMVQDIQKLKQQADIVIVSYHWGVSGTTTPISYQTEIAQAVIEAGADLVFGHGPHMYQKIELYQGKPIFYSLGQAVFDDIRDNRNKKHPEGLLANVVIKNKKLRAVTLVPSWRAEDNELRLYDPNEGKGRELFDYLQSVNDGGAELVIEGKEIVVKGIK